MRSSEGEVARSSRRVEKSEMKEDLEHDGGRYIVRMVYEMEENESLTQRDSNDGKEGIGTF